MNYSHTSKVPRGSILLLSLLATTSILAGAIAVSTILVREIRLSKDIDNALLAFLGSEGALEEGLYGLRKEGKAPGALTNSGTLSNRVSWSIQASETQLEVIFDSIRKNLSETINLFNNSNPSASAGVESISLEWTLGNNLELIIREWDGATLGAPIAQTIPCGPQIPCAAIINNSLSSTKAYEIKIKAIGADIIDLKARAWTNDGATGSNVAIPVPTTIAGTASSGSSKQALTASLPQTLPWQP